MKKSKLIILSALTAMSLTSCSLFNDDDIVVENHFSVKEEAGSTESTGVKVGDVEAIKVSDVPGASVFKNVVYSNLPDGKIENTYKTGGANYTKYNVNDGEDYVADKNNNNFDLYVPANLDREQEHNVILFIHGGAWISGLKSHVNPYVKLFANEGYIAATIEYTLLSKDMDDPSLSIFRDLDEIDACVTTMVSCLKSLGFKEDKLSLVIGGASSGAHLAMLYAYSRATHPLPIKFIVDAVGPTDIQEDVWKAFKVTSEEELNAALDAGIEYTTIKAKKDENELRVLPVAGQGYDWNEYQTMRIANGMCGLPFELSEVEASTTDEKKETVTDKTSDVYKSIVSDTLSGEKLLSVTYHLKSSVKIPILCAYAGKDSVVGIGQFANLEDAMIHNSDKYVKGTDYEFFYFKNCGHVDLDTDTEQYTAFSNKILDWLKNK